MQTKQTCHDQAYRKRPFPAIMEKTSHRSSEAHTQNKSAQMENDHPPLHILETKAYLQEQNMNYLWGIMMLIGVVYGALTGNLEAVTEQALSSAKEAVSLCITMAGVMAFWVGMMQIADSAGIIRQAAKALDPVISFLFPALSKNHPARKPIATNMVANVLGLGWAATPAGLEAMKALEAERYEEQAYVERDAGRSATRVTSAHADRDTGKHTTRMTNAHTDGDTGKHATRARTDHIATDTMCDFLILNISSLQLIPVSIIAYRSQYGSVNPSYIVGPAIIATMLSTLAAVVFIKLRQAVGRHV